MKVPLPSSLSYSHHHHLLNQTTLAELKASCSLISSSILGKCFGWTLQLTAQRNATAKAQTHTKTCFWQFEEISQEDTDFKHSALNFSLHKCEFYFSRVWGWFGWGGWFLSSFQFLIFSSYHPPTSCHLKSRKGIYYIGNFLNQVPQYWSLLFLTHIERHDVNSCLRFNHLFFWLWRRKK